MTSYKNPSEIILYDENPGIKTLAKINTVELIKFLSDQLEATVSFWSVGKTSFEGANGKRQIVELIRLIIDEYPHLKISDIKLVFTNAKKGYYGKAYDRMDGAMIMEWFLLYHEQRLEDAERVNTKKHSMVAKEEIKDNRTPEQRKEDLLKLANVYGEVAKKYPDEIPIMKKIEPIFNYKTVEDWCKDRGTDPVQFLESWESKIKAEIVNTAAIMKIDYGKLLESFKKNLLQEINFGIYG